MSNSLVARFALVAKAGGRLLGFVSSTGRPLVPTGALSTLSKPTGGGRLLQQTPRLPSARHLSFQELTSSLTFVSKEPKLFLKSTADSKSSEQRFALDMASTSTLAQKEDLSRLCILFGGFFAAAGEQERLMTYGKFYLEQDFDLLLVRVNPFHLLWPRSGSHLVAKDVLTFMASNPHFKKVFLHGFSVAYYFWGEVLIRAQKYPEKYAFLHDRFAGQIWDSPIVGVDGFEAYIRAMGGMIKSNPQLVELVDTTLETLQGYPKYCYAKACDVQMQSPVRAPALIYASTEDTYSVDASVENVAANWQQQGVEVFMKTYLKTNHTLHMRLDPEGYQRQMKSFLSDLGLLKYPGKFVLEKTSQELLNYTPSFMFKASTGGRSPNQ